MQPLRCDLALQTAAGGKAVLWKKFLHPVCMLRQLLVRTDVSAVQDRLLQIRHFIL